MKWNLLEKLCGSIGFSLFAVYLATFILYLLTTDMRWCWLISGACLALAGLRWRALGGFLRGRVRPALAGFFFLLLWSFLFLGLIQHYSGGAWEGDWLEHYHRVLFFLRHLPPETVFFGNYSLGARPPMMNVLGAFFLAQVGSGFENFQLTFAFLSLLVVFPARLIVVSLKGSSAIKWPMFVALFALNPMFVENVVYTWTKLFAAFYVITGLAFYLTGLRKDDSVRRIVGIASLAVGILVHYSACVYLLIVAIHHLLYVGRTPRTRWRESVLVSGVCILILATWFSWSISRLGFKQTFYSNSTLSPLTVVTEPPASKIALNLVDTLVPHPLRPDVDLHFLQQTSSAGYLRDYTFLIYQTNLLAMIGSVGGVIALILFGRTVINRFRQSADARFWLFLIIASVVVGVAVVSERNRFGVAHVTLQPIAIIGLALVAAAFCRLPQIVRWLVIVGCILDFAVGIWLQVSLESLEVDASNPTAGPFRIVQIHNNLGNPVKSIATDLSETARFNVLSKYARASSFGYDPPAHLEFLGEHLAGWSGLLRRLILLLAIGLFMILIHAAISRHRRFVSTAYDE